MTPGQFRLPGLSLIVIVLILVTASVPAVHAATPLTVTVTTNPQSLSPGGSSAVLVTVMVNGNPVERAVVTISTGTYGSLSPSIGITDASGRFSTTLSAAQSASGTLHVTADASYTPFVQHYVPETSYGTGSADITVNPLQVSIQPSTPVGAIMIDRNSGSAPLTVMFDGTLSHDPDGSIRDYAWSYGDNTFGSGYIAPHVFNAPGSYTAMLVVTDNDGLTSLPVTVEIMVQAVSAHAVTSMPAAVIAVNCSFGPAPLAVAFDGTGSFDPAGNISDWQWDFGDRSTAHGPTLVHTYPGTGSYDTILTVTGTGKLSDFSTIRIIAEPPLQLPAGTSAPLQVSMPALAVIPGPGNPAPPAASVIPPAVLPLAGIVTGIILGLAATVVTREKSGDPGKRKFQEFVKVTLGRRGVGAMVAWENARRKITVIKRKEVVAGLSVAEILVAVISAVLVGCAFYLLYPDPEHILTTAILFTSVAGVSVVISDLARRWMARRHGHYAEYQLWPLGTIIMFLTAWAFACACGKPSRPVFEVTQDKTPGELASECLAGPAASVLLAGLFALLVPLGGWMKTICIVGISLNILLALYALMPFWPMDGPNIWKWSRGRYLAVFIFLLVIYIGIAYISW